MLLGISAVLLGFTAIVHSLLGERYILTRLAKLENLPRLHLGGREMMRPVLRFAWHITSFFMLGFAVLLVLMAADALSARNVAGVIGVTFLACALVSAVASKGRHLSWILFLLVGGASLHAYVT